MKALLLPIIIVVSVAILASCTYEHRVSGYIAPGNGRVYAQQGNSRVSVTQHCGQQHARGIVCRRDYSCGSRPCTSSRAASFRGPTLTGKCGCSGRAIRNGSSWNYQRIRSCGSSGCRYHSGAPEYIRRNPPRISARYSDNHLFSENFRGRYEDVGWRQRVQEASRIRY